MVQWLRLCASTAGGLIPGQGTKIPRVTRYGQKKKKKKKLPENTSYSLTVSAGREPGRDVAGCLRLGVSEEVPSSCRLKTQLGLEAPLLGSLKGLSAGGLSSSLWASP